MFFEGGSMRSAGFNRLTTPWAGAAHDHPWVAPEIVIADTARKATTAK